MGLLKVFKVYSLLFMEIFSLSPSYIASVAPKLISVASSYLFNIYLNRIYIGGIIIFQYYMMKTYGSNIFREPRTGGPQSTCSPKSFILLTPI
nr:MAG TPA: hypothetical protein [Caudoviricetes sp.]